MSFLIVASKLDMAAKNIAEKLIQKYSFRQISSEIYQTGSVQLTYIEGESIFSSELDRKFKVDAIVFASRHSSVSEEPTLTVHVPGNFTEDISHGGEPKKLAWAWCQRMRNALLKLAELKPALKNDYKVSLEVTHHGPTEFEVPVWFVEIGGTKKFWVDDDAGAVVADAIWASLTYPLNGKSSVGFGGGHYAPKFTKLALNGEFAVGHIMPKYSLDAFDERMAVEAFKKTFDRCETAIIDWKGMKGGQRQLLLSVLERLNIKEIVKA